MNYKVLAIVAVLSTGWVFGCEQAAPVANKPMELTDLPQFKAKRTMDKSEFWRIIDFAYQHAQGDSQLQETLLIKGLEQHSAADIVEFECLLRQIIIDADDFKVMAAEKIIEGSVSDDSFLYFRCWLIGQGEQIFTEALRNPDSLSTIVTEETTTDFELLLYVATQTYQYQTGKGKEDDSFPRNVAAKRGLDYDFGSQTKGQDWTPEQLPMLLPKLWGKFQ